MAKVDVELVKMVLQRTEMDVRDVAQIIQEIEKEVENQKEEEQKPPPIKKQLCLMVSDPNRDLPENKDFVGWVLQIPEEDSPAVTEERLIKAACEYNATSKGRKNPVKTIGEVCEYVPTRILKEQNVWVRSKEALLMLKTVNNIEEAALSASENPE